MRIAKLATGLAFSAALMLPTGAALAGATTSNILQGIIDISDSDLSANQATVIACGTTIDIFGTITGTGLADDTVVFDWFVTAPDTFKGKSNKLQVRQKELSRIDVTITPGVGSPTNAYGGSAQPVKGRIQGDVRDKSGSEDGKFKAQFEIGTGLSALLPTPDTDQVNTILAALTNLNAQSKKSVKGNENKGKVQFQGKGSATNNGCP